MKVIIPQDLNEITLKQMIKLADIEKLEIDEVEKAKEVIKLLVDKVDDSNINGIKVLDLLAMYKKLCAMTNTETSLIKLVSIEGVKYGFNRIVARPSWSETVTIRLKSGFPFWFQYQFYQGLTRSISDGGNA